jgi:hypothetical protein
MWSRSPDVDPAPADCETFAHTGAFIDELTEFAGVDSLRGLATCPERRISEVMINGPTTCSWSGRADPKGGRPVGIDIHVSPSADSLG